MESVGGPHAARGLDSTVLQDTCPAYVPAKNSAIKALSYKSTLLVGRSEGKGG